MRNPKAGYKNGERKDLDDPLSGKESLKLLLGFCNRETRNFKGTRALYFLPLSTYLKTGHLLAKGLLSCLQGVSINNFPQLLLHLWLQVCHNIRSVSNKFHILSESAASKTKSRRRYSREQNMFSIDHAQKPTSLKIQAAPPGSKLTFAARIIHNLSTSHSPILAAFLKTNDSMPTMMANCTRNILQSSMVRAQIAGVYIFLVTLPRACVRKGRV